MVSGQRSVVGWGRWDSFWLRWVRLGGLESCFPAGFVKTDVLLVETGGLPRLACRPCPVCRVLTKKAAPPTGRGNKKRESPRLALRRATPTCANLACPCGIVQGREESVEAQGMTRNTMRQALHGLCGTWGCHSPRQSGFGTGAGLESHVLYQVAKRVESKGVSRAAIRACCGCQSVASRLPLRHNKRVTPCTYGPPALERQNHRGWVKRE